MKYLSSLRLRTLPLSMSGIILGSGLAYPLVKVSADGITPHFWLVFCLAIITTLSLQILSNLSNELGDALMGTDNEQHGRKAYGMQAGLISPQEMKWMISLFIAMSIIFGTALVRVAFGTLLGVNSAVFLALGALAIVGAMTYTLGKHNYGYKGLGDLGVFLFFGLLSTMGAFYLQTLTLTAEVIVAAIAIAMPNVGVLNLNNIRDIDNDIKHGKRTLASRLGKTGGKIYHALLIAVCLALFMAIRKIWVLCAIPVLAWHIVYVFRHDGNSLDVQMPVLMFTTLAIALLALL